MATSEKDFDRDDRDQLIALVDELRTENLRLKERIAELEKKNPTKRLDVPYSVRSEEERQAKAKKVRKPKQAKKPKRRGRRTNCEKVDLAERIELVLPDGYKIEECVWLCERPVWRIENGQAIRVVYDMYRGPRGERGAIDGVPDRSEFGLEIQVAVAYLTYIIGISLDKVCAQLDFFWGLPLSKSQADAILNQLSRRWNDEFEALCQLLSVSAVVHADETSWSINSVWAFLSDTARVLVFGCRKDGQTLATLLAKEDFSGVLVSDDAAVYQGFDSAQKCWAHLLRKAIRLTLLRPDDADLRRFADDLLEVYRTAKRDSNDARFGPKARAVRVDRLNEMLSAALGDRFIDGVVPTDEVTKEFYLLVHELARLMVEEELFTFVLRPEADGTNNEAERSLRGAALDRRTGRASKTAKGARRKTILVSVFESLKLHLPRFDLASVLKEVFNWQPGESLFTRLMQNCGLSPPKQPTLEQLVPTP